MRVKDISELPDWAQQQIRQTESLELKPFKFDAVAFADGLQEGLAQMSERLRGDKQPSRTDQHISEKSFMANVIKLATLTGWLCYHTFNSRRSSPGFPDLVMVKPPNVLFIELKREKGKLSEAQRLWKETLEQCPGVSYGLWTPSQWVGIEKILSD